MPIEPGARVGAYEVGELIGRGGMGVVYRAYHAELERDCAIKVLQTLANDPSGRSRFRREAVAIAKMRHPNIVAVFDFGDFDGVPYMVVEYVPGGALDDRMALAEPLGPVATLNLLRGIASALDYAHELGIVHRDVKPANVLLGHRDAPVLADFGLAKVLEQSTLTVSGTTSGTPNYMAPEQISGGSSAVGPAADVYALSTLAYELLTGRLPFEADGLMKVLYSKMSEEPTPPSRHRSELGPVVDEVLLRGLARDPLARWASAGEMVAALTAALAANANATDPVPLEPPAPPPTPAEAPGPASPRRARFGRVAMVVAAVALVAGVVALATLVRGPSGSRTAARTSPAAAGSPAASPSSAPTPRPSPGVSVVPGSVAAGGSFVVLGCCWPDGSEVEIKIIQGADTRVVGVLAVLADGTAATDKLVMPGGFQPGPATVRGCGGANHCVIGSVTISS